MAQGSETHSAGKEFVGNVTVTGSISAASTVVTGRPGAAVHTVAAAGGGAQTDSIQVNDEAGTAMAEPVSLSWYLADDAAGITPSTLAPDGGVAAGTDGALIESVANLSGFAVTEADGDLDVTVTATTGSWYLVLVLPDGTLSISTVITPT